MSRLFSFPDPVNEKAARVVAGVVLVLAIVTLVTGAYWLLAVMAYGFVARVLTGPALSPLGRLATEVVAPRLGAPKRVPGPPKRFAQAIGAAMTTSGAILALGFGLHTAADVILVMLVLAAGLESILAFCVGCQIFGLLMRVGLIPAEVCERCADIWSRPGMARST
jgi:HAMP domain-containing protein